MCRQFKGSGIDFAHCGLESGMVLREVREFMNICIVSISNEMERKKCEFELDFRNLVFVVIVAVVVVCLLLLLFFFAVN